MKVEVAVLGSRPCGFCGCRATFSQVFWDTVLQSAGPTHPYALSLHAEKRVALPLDFRVAWAAKYKL